MVLGPGIGAAAMEGAVGIPRRPRRIAQGKLGAIARVMKMFPVLRLELGLRFSGLAPILWGP